MATNEQMEKVTNGLMKACADMNALASETVGATVQSVTAITKGYSEVCSVFGTLVQSSLSHALNAGQALAGIKNPQDLMSAQANLVKAGVETVTTELGKISQISARTAQQAAEPITNHVNATISKLSNIKAA